MEIGWNHFMMEYNSGNGKLTGTQLSKINITLKKKGAQKIAS